MKKVIITGVTGQLGSTLLDHFLDKGFEVVGFSRRVSTNTLERIQHNMDNPNFTYLEGDLCDFQFLVKLFSEHLPDYCVNTAAQSHVHTSFENPSSTWDITAKGAMNIVDVIRLISPDTKLVHLSSSEMFGNVYDVEHIGNPPKNGFHTYTEYRYQDENTRMNPKSPYAIAKLAAHNYVRLMRESYGLDLSSVIAFNYEGARRGENFVTQKIVKWFAEYSYWLEGCEFGTGGIALPDRDDYVEEYGCPLNKPKFVKLRLGNLDACRDWSHASDVVAAIDLMLEKKSCDDYVIGTGETHTVQDFLEEICELSCGHRDFSKYVVIDPKFIRPSEVDYLRARPDKAKRELGWEPKYNFKSLAKDMYEAAKEKIRR